MSQVNNNAESLSRELRKLKNIKTVDFKGLLSGNAESYVNLYRHLFCENNISFSRYIVEKGYDLSGLNDYKFMELVYKMMRDLFNLKPPINQNQFFSQGFTQRKLEMSTLLAAHIRKVGYELNNRGGKKTVQTQSLMKSSLKRPSSAPKQARAIELGDEEGNHVKQRGYSAVLNENHGKKTKANKKYLERNSNFNEKINNYNINYSDQDNMDVGNNVSSDYSDHSNPPNINPLPNPSTNNYTYMTKSNIHTNENNHADNNHDIITRNAQKYPTIPLYKSQIDSGTVSAYESGPLEHDSFIRPAQQFNSYIPRNNDNHDHRAYDVNQYTPRSEDDQLLPNNRGNDNVVTLDRVMKQFDTVLARITLLESRVQRMEMKYDTSNKSLLDHQPDPHPNYSAQNNQNYSQYNPPHNYHETNKFIQSNDRNSHVIRDSRNIISDFESNYQGNTSKNYLDRAYQSYVPNSVGSIKSDFDRPYQTYGTNHSGSYQSHLSTDISNTIAPKYINTLTNYSDKRSADLNNSSRESSYRGNNGSIKSSQPISKMPNGIPPTHPTMKKSEDLDDHRHGKTNFGKSDSYIQTQTDRIASLLSDTQKMLKISDEEL